MLLKCWKSVMVEFEALYRFMITNGKNVEMLITLNMLKKIWYDTF